MKPKHLIVLLVVAALAFGGFTVWQKMRVGVVFKLKAQEALEKQVTRVPSLDQILGVPAALKAAARDVGVKNPDDWKTTMQVQGRGSTSATMWYLIVRFEDSTGESVDLSQQIETEEVVLNNVDKIEAAGIKFKK